MGRINKRFQSTLPARGATDSRREREHLPAISIHAPRTGSDVKYVPIPLDMAISIHAPRTGSDAPPAPGRPETSPYFNPRSPHGERHVTVVLPLGEGVFQSTLPARGATRHPHSRRYPQHHFNPRSPHGERPSSSSASLLPAHFNPRSPHGERLRAPCGSFRYDDFNPRSPHGERPGLFALPFYASFISIHAPRTGSD